MRVVFRVEEDIPDLAEAGDRVIFFLDGRSYPVSVVSNRPRSAVETLTHYAHHLSLVDPETTELQDLAHLLRRLHAPVRLL